MKYIVVDGKRHLVHATTVVKVQRNIDYLTVGQIAEMIRRPRSFAQALVSAIREQTQMDHAA